MKQPGREEGLQLGEAGEPEGTNVASLWGRPGILLILAFLFTKVAMLHNLLWLPELWFSHVKWEPQIAPTS
jgi:hypothetical protein